MKRLFLIWALISAISCRKNESASFDIHIENTDRVGVNYNLNQLIIYKNDTLFKKIGSKEPIRSLDEHIKIDSIRKGRYSFVYESIFGKEIKEVIQVDDSGIYGISVNPDRSPERLKNLVIENLKNDRVKWVYNSSGCFHHDDDSIILSNNGNDYFIQYKGQPKKVDEKVWSYFVNTENAMRQIPKNGGCTTIDTYVLSYRGKSDTMIDNTCRFRIWSHLKDYLNNNKL